jgi:hypothetical protein
MNLKDIILAAPDIRTRKVDVPEWNCTLHVKNMTGTERTKFRTLSDKLEKDGKSNDADTWLVVYSASDEAGNRVFADSDFAALNNKDASILTRIAKEALIVNGLVAEAVDIEKKD